MSSSFHASTVDWLGSWIAAGQVKPGQTIKVEADLGEQLGVSRTVIREAIKTLVAKGMLEVGPKVGTRVLPVRRWNLFDPQVVGWLSRNGLPENFVDDLLDLRRTIEPMAVRWACERASLEQIHAVQRAYNALERAVDSGIDYNRADQVFHECILAASHNQFIEQMVPALGALLAVSFEVSAADPDELRRTLPIHKDMADAIAARDAARGVWACMTLIDNADLAIKRFYPQVMADKKPAENTNSHHKNHKNQGVAMSWTAVTQHRARLGEGPFWDAPTQALYWVDIAGQQALRLIGNNVQIWQMPEHVSAFIPCASGDALVTLSSGVYRLDLDSPGLEPRLTLFCIADPQPGNRPNEARCDAQGRLWLGTMQNNIGANGEDLPVERRSGGLFRIDPDQRVTPLLRGLGIPNTLLWSDDGTTLLFGDSLDGVLNRYFIHTDGNLDVANRWYGPDQNGGPDGSAMDAEGYVWNARWDGNCLLRLTPEGQIDRKIDLPVSRPTSCVFGGEDLKTLYITSAQSPHNHPLDGALLSMRVDVPGKLCTRFAG